MVILERFTATFLLQTTVTYNNRLYKITSLEIKEIYVRNTHVLRSSWT